MASQHTYTVHLNDTSRREVDAANFAEQGRWLVFVDLSGDPVLTVDAGAVVSVRRGDPVIQAPAAVDETAEATA